MPERFKCRHEELPFLGRIVHSLFNRDKSDFTTFSPDYVDVFGTTFETQNNVVMELVTSKKITAEIKKLTQKLGAHFKHGRNLLNKLERYARKALKSGLALTISPDDFGFKEARKDINKKNDEGVIKYLKLIQSNFNVNLQILETKGYTVAIQTEFDTLIKELSDDSVAQTMKKKEREVYIKNNIDEFNKLWDIIDDVLKSGKAIYKEKDPSKVKDYTYAQLIKTVRLQRTQEEDDETPET